jgi:hypothetical protein
MKTLIKTDKVIKIDPRNVVDFYRFVKHYIHWEYEDYRNELNKRFPDKISDYIAVGIPLDAVILPSYMISEVPTTLEHIIKPERKDAIYLEDFSYFNLYKVVDDPNGGVTNTVISFSIDYHESEGAARIQGMLLTVEYLHSKNRNKTLYVDAIFDKDFISEDALIRALNFLSWARGRSYSDFPQKGSSLMQRLLDLERSLTVFLNFLHALYTNRFDDDEIVSWLFKPYSDLVKGFGCEFEEAVLSAVKIISAFLF